LIDWRNKAAFVKIRTTSSQIFLTEAKIFCHGILHGDHGKDLAHEFHVFSCEFVEFVAKAFSCSPCTLFRGISNSLWLWICRSRPIRGEARYCEKIPFSTQAMRMAAFANCLRIPGNDAPLYRVPRFVPGRIQACEPGRR